MLDTQGGGCLSVHVGLIPLHCIQGWSGPVSCNLSLYSLLGKSIGLSKWIQAWSLLFCIYANDVLVCGPFQVLLRSGCWGNDWEELVGRFGCLVGSSGSIYSICSVCNTFGHWVLFPKFGGFESQNHTETNYLHWICKCFLILSRKVWCLTVW